VGVSLLPAVIFRPAKGSLNGMHISFAQVLSLLFALLALCGAGFLSLAIFAIVRWKQVAHPPTTYTPPISILKSLRGTDPSMYEAFRSHCQQDYPQFELLFGVSDPNDPAIVEVERLQREFPERRILLVQCPTQLGPNGKVSNLVQLVHHTTAGFILINDSDIRVAPDYLRKVAAHFADERVGMVTALYRAEPGHSLASRIEALTIATDFVAGVLSARIVEGGIHFALGSTLAIRRRVLDEIGGLSPLLDYLADDYELGARTSRAGHRVALADTVVDTHLPSYGFKGMIDHQLRWARTIRDTRRGGYLGLVFTFALPWALLACALAKASPLSVVLLAFIAVLRIGEAYLLCDTVLDDRRTLRDLWLVPLRDCIALYVWIATFAGNTVVWRGEKFRVRFGKLTRI
jgi:ceramide glucosyltransferase